MNSVRIFVAPAVLALTALAAGLIGQGTAFAASAEKGKAAYIQYGCWQCHGFDGQGSVTSNGKVLARTPLPLDAFIAFVRTTNGQMPPYRPPVLTDEALADMYAYLQSLPQPKSASDIPLLGEVRSQ
jgi:ubiquinol-cytochrome c reductase cytochrome c subunit